MSGKFTFTKATKVQAKARLAVFGPSGAGKTFSSLRVASGIVSVAGGTIGVIDTEYGAASKYSDRFSFETLQLRDPTIEDYIAALGAAAEAGFSVIVIDSLSHGWQALLEEVDRLASTRYRGNSHAAWAEGTPKQKALVRAINACPAHLIATMRSNTAWEIADDGRGRTKPTRVGLKPEQGKGIEYEFDLLMEMSIHHDCEIIKDRSGRFQDRTIKKPGEDFGKELAEWLSDGVAPPEDHRALAAAELERWSGVPRSERDDFRAAFRLVCEAHGIDAEDPDYKRVREVIRAAEAEGLTFAAVTVQDKPKAEPATEPAPKAKPSGKAKAAPVLIPDADAADDIDTPF